MIDAGVIAAYLAAAAARAGKHLLDRAVDGALDRLTDSVARRLGQGPAADLAGDPTDGAALTRVAQALDAAARRDERFARELTDRIAELDRLGAWEVVNHVQAGLNVQAFGGGNAAGRDYFEGDRYHNTNDYDPGDELVSGRGPGRLVAWFGLLLALSGFAGWMSVIFTGFRGSGSDNPILDPEIIAGVPLAPVAFGAFLVGGLLYGLGASISKAARKRAEEATARRRRGR